MTQKFHRGDLVRIADDLGPTMSHFKSGCEAIVVASYHEKFGHGGTEDYSLYLKGGGECSWYYGSQLTLIEPGRLDLLDQWRRAAEDERITKADLDWIFSNGQDVLESPHGASLQALATCLGCDDLWGSHGEGFVYWQNAIATLSRAKPFLLAGDRAGWEKYAAEYREGKH